MIRLAAEDKLIQRLLWEEVAPGKHSSDPQFHLARLACDTVLPGPCPACSLPPGGLFSLPAHSLSPWPTLPLCGALRRQWTWCTSGGTGRHSSNHRLSSEYFPRVCFFTSLLILYVFRCCNCCQSRRYELSHCFNLHFLDY